MDSIFDGITTPTQASYGQTANGHLSSQPVTAAHASATAAHAPSTMIWSTGIIASVEPGQFEQLVRDSIDPVVLRTGSQAGSASGGSGRRLHRYVFSCAGITFVTQTTSLLSFDRHVREVECLGVLCDGKPIGRNDSNVL